MLKNKEVKEANKILLEILSELQQQKEKKMININTLKGLNSRFQNQMRKIQNIRNTKNKKYRNKWYTVFHQELAILK